MRSRATLTVASRRAASRSTGLGRGTQWPPKMRVRSVSEPVAYTIVLFSQPKIAQRMGGAGLGRDELENFENAATQPYACTGKAFCVSNNMMLVSNIALQMQGFEPYHERRVRSMGIWEEAGWRIKLYGIAYRGDSPRPGVVEAAKRVAASALPQPPVTGDRYGVGFLIVHEGRDGCWCLIDWWGEEDILFHRLFAAPLDQPQEMRPVTDGRTACVGAGCVGI